MVDNLWKLALICIASCLLPVTCDADEEIEVLFTSQNGRGESRLADRVCEAIGGAEESIDIAVAHLNYERIAKAIVERQEEVEGLEVRVLLDYSEYGAYQRSMGPLLEKAGVPVRYKLYSLAYYHFKATLMHHKFMIVDGETLLAGSYNWSETAERSNDENLLVFRSASHPKVLRTFAREFEGLWELGRKTYPAFRKAVTDDDGPRYLPIHFNTRYFGTPMSLSRREIEPILAAVARYGLYDIEKCEESNYFDRKEKEVLDRVPGGAKFLDED